MFTNQDLKKLIIPLFLEQLLVALVGIADVFVIGFVGEAAVSGVSLVNAFNMIFINLFTALASGGAVVISQYIGKKDKEQAGAAASQLLTASVLLSVVISVVVLVANEQLMRLMFGKVEDDVMAACVTYLRISAYSYPAMAIYNAGAALYRSFGNQHDDVPFDCIECDQRSRKLYRRLCFAYRCAWRCGSVADCAYLFRSCYHGSLLLKAKSGAVSERVDF